MVSDDLAAAIAKLSAADREKLRTRAKAPIPDVTPPKPALAGGNSRISDVEARWAAKGHDRYGRRLRNMQWKTCAPDEDPLKDFDDL
jgi:hypothetical protein